jgi:hypothetical protein
MSAPRKSTFTPHYSTRHFWRFSTELQNSFPKQLLVYLHAYFVRYLNVEKYFKELECRNGCTCNGSHHDYSEDTCMWSRDYYGVSQTCTGHCFCPNLRVYTCAHAAKYARNRSDRDRYRAMVRFLSPEKKRQMCLELRENRKKIDKYPFFVWIVSRN